MLKSLANKLLAPSISDDCVPYRGWQETILERSDQLRRFPDNTLKRLDSGNLIEIFSQVVEVADRTLGLRPFPVQILAALALAEGNVVEMQTGEGKTLTATLPAVYHALTGRGCHILTFNDYLAKRDAEWMRPIYEFFGLRVGLIHKELSWKDRQYAYRAKITYATAKEAGFDYLRTQLCTSESARLHRQLAHVIVDEADSILIDEARIPLIIAGPTPTPAIGREVIASLVLQLGESCWEIDTHARNVVLTDPGVSYIEALLHCGSLHSQENQTLLTQINQALHACHLLSRDVDYIVRDGGVELVDEFTGRVALDRRWPDGLQGAIEAKEGLALRDDGRILASITLQNFIRSYTHVSGMTATAKEDADELEQIYGTKVILIPPNVSCRRIDHADILFSDKHAKELAVIEEIQREHNTGRPVLVGTASVEESKRLARLIQARGLSCNVLNAVNDSEEAGIVAQAGMPQAITISTNMAGRGTDIKLGGVLEGDRHSVVHAGGLHVVGTNRFESQRIDRQLRGRAGRQGDPGSSRFFISLEDYLMVRFHLREHIPRGKYPTDGTNPVEDPVVARGIDWLQRTVSAENAKIRRTLMKYSQLLENQRQTIQHWRDSVLAGEEIYVQSCRNYQNLLAQYGKEKLAEMEQQLILKHIDRVWAEHLAVVADIRESAHLTIQLTDIGGLDPFLSYRTKVGEAFWQLKSSVIQRVIDKFEARQLHLDERSTGRPSGTWTYLVNDQFFDEHQRLMHIHISDGTGTMAVLLAWPFMLVWGIWRRLIGKSWGRSDK